MSTTAISLIFPQNFDYWYSDVNYESVHVNDWNAFDNLKQMDFHTSELPNCNFIRMHTISRGREREKEPMVLELHIIVCIVSMSMDVSSSNMRVWDRQRIKSTLLSAEFMWWNRNGNVCACVWIEIKEISSSQMHKTMLNKCVIVFATRTELVMLFELLIHCKCVHCDECKSGKATMESDRGGSRRDRDGFRMDQENDVKSNFERNRQ